jgi:hypothetical protein
MHVYSHWTVTRTGGQPRAFDSLHGDREQTAREYAAATPASGWPVVLQRHEAYRECWSRLPTGCPRCDAPDGGEVRAFSDAVCLAGDLGVPERCVVHQELLHRPTTP